MTTILLREFVRDILPDYIFRDDQFIYLQRHPSSRSIPYPALTKGIPNGILIFPGSFNPPHNAHECLLDHVFAHAGEDINLVAAFVVIRDDDILEENKSSDNIRLQLPVKMRGELWRSSTAVDVFSMIWDYGEREWRDFQEKLEAKANREGYPLHFYLLRGPNDVSMYDIPDPTEWACRDVITSNVTSPPDFFEPLANHLLKVEGGQEWKRIPYRPDVLGLIAKANLGTEPTDDLDNDEQEEEFEQEVLRIHRTCDSIRMCCVKMMPRKGKTVRFEVRFVPGLRHLGNFSTSSMIRNKILRANDASGTVNPSLTIEFVAGLRRTQPFEEINWDDEERVVKEEDSDKTVPDMDVASSWDRMVLEAALRDGEPKTATPDLPLTIRESIERARLWLEKTPRLGVR